jgi:uncharacterized protein (DUF305 family)
MDTTLVRAATEMKRSGRSPRLRALAMALLVSGCTSAREPATASPSAAEFERLYRMRTDSARMRFSPADASFMTGMISHHAQAIVMARLVPARSTTPAIQTLAGRVINAQRDEINNMQQWLRDRRQPVPEVHITDADVMVHGGDHAHMPGMLTAEQMKQLEAAKGSEFDRLFLTLMIQHHEGAVTMVDALIKAGGAGQDDTVFKIASDIQVDQTTEIARMKQMLAALPVRTP